MVDTRFADWAGHAEAVYGELAARCDRVVVAGISMGGTITCWLAARYPEIAGIVCINPAVQPVDAQAFEMAQLMLDAGEVIAPGVGSDICDPDATEDAYLGSPIEAARSMFEAIAALQDDLPKISCPVLIMTSLVDHVVLPEASDLLAEKVSGPVERLTLERSFHVATLDHDKDLIGERAVDFARKVTAG
jgi:carboxylesterase